MRACDTMKLKIYGRNTGNAFFTRVFAFAVYDAALESILLIYRYKFFCHWMLQLLHRWKAFNVCLSFIRMNKIETHAEINGNFCGKR